MKRFKSRIKTGVVLVGLSLLLTACMGRSIYQKAGLIGGGYGDKALGSGAYEVYFANGPTLEFTKASALYRSAELTYENNYRYFTVTKLKDSSLYYENSGALYMAQIQLNIQCSTEQPEKGYDAYDFLNKNLIPGTKEYYTVAERREDKKKEKK